MPPNVNVENAILSRGFLSTGFVSAPVQDLSLSVADTSKDIPADDKYLVAGYLTKKSAAMPARKHAAVSSLLYAAMVAWCYCVGMISAQTAATTQYLRMTWSGTDIVQVTCAEPMLTPGVASFFGTEQVQVIDIREDSFPMSLEAATQSTFRMLFMVRNPPQVVTAADFNKTKLATVLVSTLLTAATESSSDGSKQAISTDSTTTTLASFIETSVQFELLSAADAQPLGPFPALVTLDAPSGSQSFMVLHVFVGNRTHPIATLKDTQLVTETYFWRLARHLCSEPPTYSCRSLLVLSLTTNCHMTIIETFPRYRTQHRYSNTPPS